MAPPGQTDYPMGTSRSNGPPPAPGAGGVDVLKGTGSSGAAPPGMNVDASSHGGGPPPPAPGAGGAGIKRGSRASSSSAPMEVDSSYYCGGPPRPRSAGAIAAQIATSMLQQAALAQHATQYAMTEAHIAGILHAHHTEEQKRIIAEEIQPVHHNTLKSILKKSRVVQAVAPAPPSPKKGHECRPSERRRSCYSTRLVRRGCEHVHGTPA